MSRVFLLVISVAVLCPSALTAAQDDGRELDTIAKAHHACRDANVPGRRALYVVDVPASGFALAAHDPDEGLLPIDTRRNLRILRGAAELFPSRLESIGFVANEERAQSLRAAAQSGASLRLGFFLAFDGGRACLVRSAMSVTTMRIDVAFIELVGRTGGVLAREDSDRLRAWRDDADRVPGNGARGVIADLTIDGQDRPAPAGAELSAELGACLTAAQDRGAPRTAQVMVRFRRGEGASVALSSLGDTEGAACVANIVAAAVSGLPGRHAIATVRLTR